MKFSPILIVSPLLAFNVLAERFDPAPIKLTDGFSIIPKVTTTARYDDNIYNETTDTSSSSIFILKPSIKFGVDDGINRYGGIYELISGTYSNGSDDNYLDQSLVLFAHTEYTDKHRTDFKFGFNNEHEDRGSGISEGNSSAIDKPLKYNELTARGYYQYGGINALMRVGGGVDFKNKTYQNFTSETKYNDVNELKFFVDADYQIASVTFLTFDLYTTDIQYQHLRAGSVSSDNIDSRALIGFKWRGFGKTTATVKGGYQYKTFDSSERESFSGNTVDIGLTWKPIEYSSFSAHFIRDAKETDTVGDYIRELASSIEWRHYWTEDFDSKLQFIYTDEDYIGFSRTDKTKNLVLDLSYDLTRWMQVKASYELTKQNSTDADISYDKNAVNLGVVIAL